MARTLGQRRATWKRHSWTRSSAAVTSQVMTAAVRSSPGAALSTKRSNSWRVSSRPRRGLIGDLGGRASSLSRGERAEKVAPPAVILALDGAGRAPAQPARHLRCGPVRELGLVLALWSLWH